MGTAKYCGPGIDGTGILGEPPEPRPRAPARGDLRPNASGIATPPCPPSWSAAHSRRARAICSRKPGMTRFGSLTARSLPPFPSRTMIVLRPKSTSFTRSCKPSLLRIPLPWSSCANNRCSPSRRQRIRATSSGDQTTGRRLLVRGRPISFIHGKSIPRTLPQKNDKADNASLCVDAATGRALAR